MLHWITGKTESHRYDESLKSIDLVTKDAYEPLLPLSVVVHIDYQRAPSVIQRFGDVKKLITQTLDPMLSAFFRDIAHKKTMLELLHEREAIQDEAREELRSEIPRVRHRMRRRADRQARSARRRRRRSKRCSNSCGNGSCRSSRSKRTIGSAPRPRSGRCCNEAAGAGRDANQADQRSRASADCRKPRRGRSGAGPQEGRANDRRGRRRVGPLAPRGRANRRAGRSDAQQRELAGRGEAQKIAQVGLAEASVLLRQIASYGDPRLYAMSRVAEHLSKSAQPLVPERMFVAGGGPDRRRFRPSGGLFGVLISLLVAEKSGFQTDQADPALAEIDALAERVTKQVMQQSLEHAAAQRVAGRLACSNWISVANR